MIPSAQSRKDKVMDQCHYCGRRLVSGQKHIIHLTGCPQVIAAHKPIWLKGWEEGRVGKVCEPSSQNPTYVMGFGKGVVALEEMENGERPY